MKFISNQKSRKFSILSVFLAFVLAVTASCLVLDSASLKTDAANSTFTATLNDTATLRAADSETAVLVGTYPKGTSVTVVSTSGAYYKVNLDGKAGYLLKTEVSTGNAVTTSEVNFRKGAGTGFDVIKTVAKGTRISVLSSSNGWYKVKIGSTTGYMSSDYVQKDTVSKLTTVKDTVASVNVGCGIYADQSLNSTKLGYLPVGTQVKLLTVGLNWCNVKSDKYTGYVRTSNLRRGNASCANSCKLRASAGTSSDALASISSGSRISVIEEGTTWTKVIYNNQRGFVLTSNIRKDKVYASSEKVNTIYTVKTSTSLLSSIGGSTIASLSAGKQVKYVSKASSEYYEVTVDGQTGYVKASSLKYGNARILADNIAIKELPDSSASTIRTLNNGARIAVYSTSNGYAKIMYGTIEGYVEIGVYEKDYTTGEDFNPSLKTFHTTAATKLSQSASDSSQVLLNLSKGAVGYRLGKSGKYWKVIINHKLGYVPAASSDYGNGLIVADSADILSKASATASKVVSLKSGDPVHVLGESGNFYKVKTSSGSGYILKAYVLKVSKNYQFKKLTSTNIVSKANLKKLAKSSSKTLKSLAKGTKVYIVKSGSKFTQVAVGGYLGYIKNAAVKVYSSGKTTTKLNMYKSTGWGADKVTTIPSGAKINIIKDYDNNYMQVEYNGNTGYVLSCYVTRTDASEYTWKYENGFKYAYDLNGNKVRDVKDLVSGPYLIRTYKWDCVTVVLAKSDSGSYDIPVKIMICSPGDGTITGTYYSPAKYSWLTMLGNTFAYWLTDIEGSYLYHTVPCWTNNHFDLEVGEYNLLGNRRSAGCVRLMSCDAKYLYDTMPGGQWIEIVTYKCPFAKPTGLQLSGSHTWDPTDPTAHWKCTQNGCH